jgi:hypothetical protein
MLDIIFISYDEKCADENFAALKERFPHAKRVHGVKGIANAHFAAAKKANTNFFYVVDADAEILPSFDFEYKPTEYEAAYTHVWYAQNPALGIAYGYGGVKLFSKKFFREVKTNLDFTTTLTKDLKIMPEVACITNFNYDPITAFRGAYRETIKLSLTVGNPNTPVDVKAEAEERLKLWKKPVADCENRKFILSGVNSALAEAARRTEEPNFLFINDHDLIMETINRELAEVYINTDPTPSKDNPMKHEFFFTSRIASILYDQFVLDNLPLTELRDAISDGQMLSKNWVVAEIVKLVEQNVIKTSHKKVLIVGGWIGTLALLMNSFELPFHITSIDLDERACKIADKMNYDFKFKSIVADMYQVDYSQYDIIINTSSEHITDIPVWMQQIPKGKIVLVQNNDYKEGDGHVSTVKSVAALKKQLKLSEIFYEGTRKFPQYNRFMVIGRA